MPRRPRIDLAGYHHIINRGVARTDIYLCDEDKDAFLAITCKACFIYKVIVHDYCLMDNHYHLLVELSDENLSLFMRQINSNYAIYFNKKYKRSGHLWQGRYLSYYIVDEHYLLTLFRYIEHNPIKANVSNSIGVYPYTLIGTLMNSKKEVIACATHSRLREDILEEGFLEHLELSLSDDELEWISKEQKIKYKVQADEYKQCKEKSLVEHFLTCTDKNLRNKAILKAIDDGYTQSSIAKYLEISTSSISKIVKKLRD